MSVHPDADRLQDYLDDLLCREERADLETHLASCPQCTSEVRGERELRRALAELPRSIAPGRDLLAGINAAIDAATVGGIDAATAAALGTPPRGVPHAAPGTAFPAAAAASARWRERPIWSLRVPLAAAALALVALTAVLTTLLVRPGERAPGARAALAGPTSDPVVRQVLAVSPSYQSANAELEAALAAVRARLDPATAQLVEANLRVVERALAEARAALRRDPNNASLAELLQHAQEQKLALLRRATRAGT